MCLAWLRPSENRHETGRQAKEEDRRSDQADRNPPLDDRRRVAFWCAPRHPTPKGHREKDYVHAVLGHAKDREEGRDEEHVGALPKRPAGQQDERKHAAEEDLGCEGYAEPSGKGSGELVAERHVSEAKHEVDEKGPERDLSD